jgi:glycopeptide antibiotics resistance protein
VHDDARREEAGGDDGHLEHDRNVPARRQDPCRVHGPHREGRQLIRALAVLHLLALAALAIGPLPLDADAIAAAREAARFDHNAEPFGTITRQLAGGVGRADMVQLVGNLLLLLPFGMYAPALWRGLRSLPAVLLAGALLSTAIELGQLGLSELYGFPIRIADVDDVILNTAGVLVGYLLWRLWSWGEPLDSNRAVRGSAD